MLGADSVETGSGGGTETPIRSPHGWSLAQFFLGVPGLLWLHLVARDAATLGDGGRMRRLTTLGLPILGVGIVIWIGSDLVVPRPEGSIVSLGVLTGLGIMTMGWGLCVAGLRSLMQAIRSRSPGTPPFNVPLLTTLLMVPFVGYYVFANFIYDAQKHLNKLPAQ